MSLQMQTWDDLNDAVRDADEGRCKILLEAEKKGKCRKQFLLRIHSRLNKVRADRERSELVRLVK